MKTQIKHRYSAKELSEMLTHHIQELAEATDVARMSKVMLDYLEMSARFHKYSTSNVWLILMACPNASLVAGFKMAAT